MGVGHQQRMGNVEILHQPRRNGAAAGLDPSGLVEQHHMIALASEIIRSSRTGRAAADHNHVIIRRAVFRFFCHISIAFPEGCGPAMAVLVATNAAMMKNMASTAKTIWNAVASCPVKARS